MIIDDHDVDDHLRAVLRPASGGVGRSAHFLSDAARFIFRIASERLDGQPITRHRKAVSRLAITKCARDPGQSPTMLTIAMLHDACRNALNCSAGQYQMPHVESTQRCPVLASSG